MTDERAAVVEHAVRFLADFDQTPSPRLYVRLGTDLTIAGFVVPLWTEGLADEVQTVSTEEAMATARSLALEEGIFAGTSMGGNVAVALRIADRLGPGRTVVTLAVDSGQKYLSTALYSDT